MAKVRRRAWAAGGLLAVGTAALLPSGAAAQSTERLWEPMALGAGVTIYPDDVADGATDVADLIQWYVPGATVSRFPGGGVHIQLRGGSRDCQPMPQGSIDPDLDPEGMPNPLVIVDGVPIANDNVSDELLSLDPFMIERVDVAKDFASGVIYGKRASCGVIRIFTRRSLRE